MNGRRLFREFAQSKGKEATEFIKIESGWYDQDTLITKNSDGELEKTSLHYKDVVHWIIKTKKNPN